jgi:succinate dehydrogenase/fumarate reductase flavoprotein subunit
MSEEAKVDRRTLIAGAGILSAAATLPAAAASAAPASGGKWDHEVDVVCVGSGAAACGAAVAAVDGGASVMLVEKMPVLGGTTGKSGGVTWIPNNFILRQAGIQDRKEDALRYMARYAHPLVYDPSSPTLGLTDRNYKLLEAFYDNGAPTIDRLQELGATRFKEFRLFQVDRPAPDYADHLPENKVSTRRTLEPASGAGSSEGGGSLAAQIEQWLRAKKVPILIDTRVTRLIMENGRVIGVEADQEGKPLRIRARKGVVFGTGGYAHNVDLCEQHQVSLYGSCAMQGSTGDFIEIAQEAGAKMGPLHTAWRTQVLLEEALDNRALGLGAFVLPGDSMILVNKYGQRCVNEKRDYNDRTMAHFTYDPTREEYPNHLMFMLFDERSIDAFGGAFPFPESKEEQPYLIEGATWDAVFSGIAARLDKAKGRTGGVALAPEFAANAKASIARFNGYAKAGRDPDFDRGLHLYDREWHLLFSARREGTRQPENPFPNRTMHPFADKGPYYALILAPGALDTNGGPLINEKAQVLGRGDKPIPGLYGAGNCIASPTRGAYLGAGGTIGPALTFGFIAGRNAARETVA